MSPARPRPWVSRRRGRRVARTFAEPNRDAKRVRSPGRPSRELRPLFVPREPSSDVDALIDADDDLASAGIDRCAHRDAHDGARRACGRLLLLHAQPAQHAEGDRLTAQAEYEAITAAKIEAYTTELAIEPD